MDTLDSLRSAAGFSSHRVKAWFGVKSDYTELKRIRSNPLELIRIPLGDDNALIGQMIHNHTEVAV
jgi:hypothetical protein